MASTTLQLRIDKKTKNNVQKIFKTMGLDMSSAVKLFLHQVLVSKSIPFHVVTENGFTPKYEKSLRKAFVDSSLEKKSKANNFGKGFNNGEDVISSILGNV